MSGRSWRASHHHNQPWKHMMIWGAIAFTFLPVVWIVSASLDPSNSLASSTVIPKYASFDNFKTIFTDRQQPIGKWYLNTLKVSCLTSILVVMVTSLMGFAFSRLRFRGRRSGLYTLVLLQMFPQMLAMVAIYLILFTAGQYIPAFGLDTHTSLILVYLGGAIGVNVWLIKSYFDTIPRSLEESVYIDGATPFQSFLHIMLPLARPILAVTFFLQFMATYSEFVLAKILLATSDKYTMAVGLHNFIAEKYTQRWGVFSAASLLGAIPILVLFWALQKQLVSGLTRGAVNE